MSINGQDVERDQARISALDYGVLYGYGVFTTLKVKNAIPLFLERHLRRLYASSERLSLGKLPLQGDLKAAVFHIIRKNEVTDGAVRITLTPGTGHTTSRQACHEPTVILHATPPRDPADFLDAITVPEQRDALRDIKETYRVIHMLGERDAARQGAQAAIFTCAGTLVEATNSNVFSVNREGALITPAIEGKGLNGICRQVLLEQGGGKIGEIPIETRGPLFLVNSLSIVAVRHLNGKALRSGEEHLRMIRQRIETIENSYICAHQTGRG